MSTAIELIRVSRRYRSATALQEISLRLEKDVIHGLLGRNGAGKTTLMSIATAQDWPSSGEVRVLGERPHENEQVLPKICFVREEQRYVDDALAKHAFAAAGRAFPNWDAELAAQLAREFRVPEKTRIKKMSRGQRSAVGVIIGIASRAEVTFFDEPYMGLDAVARQLFYDRLLEDYAEHPRTVVISSHLIDEIAHLIETVVLIDQGQILLQEPVEQLRDRAVTLVGRADAVAEIAGAREVLHHEAMGRIVRTTVLGALDETQRRALQERDVDVAPVSLQQLIVRLTAREHSIHQTVADPTEEVAR
ncbi:ATP-binding cassette domain-containing protein [Nesterenkonia sandarakina]|uniref:ABC-2 type transport system ATP-binding protein n=1 Tax=Nesterenkonia sandarakina TaxID=272918 RepID=A0A7Z0E7V5_9MICC|nr:ABC transporter ATP-binding protein [Nesterenkonia sandarakina]NYJ16683.1 ABC-2 type transport system ATP-binding protein [Nesterenkonia sandarakina]